MNLKESQPILLSSNSDNSYVLVSKTRVETWFPLTPCAYVLVTIRCDSLQLLSLNLLIHLNNKFAFNIFWKVWKSVSPYGLTTCRGSNRGQVPARIAGFSWAQLYHSLGSKTQLHRCGWILQWLMVGCCGLAYRPSAQLGRVVVNHRWTRWWYPCVKIGIFKSKASVLDWKKVARPLRVGGETLFEEERFKYPGIHKWGKHDGLVQHLQWCSHCTDVSWGRKS